MESALDPSANERFELTEQVEAELARVTALDQQLYLHAKRRFLERLSDQALPFWKALSDKKENIAACVSPPATEPSSNEDLSWKDLMILAKRLIGRG